jgi:hypothetical protein
MKATWGGADQRDMPSPHYEIIAEGNFYNHRIVDVTDGTKPSAFIASTP